MLNHITQNKMKQFLVKDLSGIGGHYQTNQTELENDKEFIDDANFFEWLDDAEIGDTYNEFNNVRITRVEEPADITNITVNRVELASNLAHNAAMYELGVNIDAHDEDSVFVQDEEGNTSYTDEAQEVFNTWYDYFYDEIGKAATK